MDEEIGDRKSPQEDELWLVPGCALNSFQCLVCGQKGPCNYINVFETTTCRRRRLSACLSAVLLTNIDLDTSTSQVICEPCQYLADEAENLELKIEHIHNKLRDLHNKTLKQLKTNDMDLQIVPSKSCIASLNSLVHPPEIPMVSLESRRKSRKDQLIPRMELSPEPEKEKQVYVKRKRGRPIIPEEIKAERNLNKKFKLQNNGKPLLKPSVLLLASTNDTSCTSAKVLDQSNTPNQLGDQFSHNFNSVETCQNNPSDGETVIEDKQNFEIDARNLKTSGGKKIVETERSKQIKRMADWFDSRLSKKRQVQESEMQETSLQKQENASVLLPETEVVQKYKLLEDPKPASSSALLLKFKRVPEEKVNYNETFDSDSDNCEDTKHTDPDYKQHKKSFGFKTRRAFGCFGLENVDKKRKKKKGYKKKGKPNISSSKTQLDKENACQPPQTLANDKSPKEEKEKVSLATDDEKKKGEHKSVKRGLKKKHKTLNNISSKHLKATAQILNITPENGEKKTCNSSYTTKSSNNSQNVENIDLNPSWVLDDSIFHEELIIKNEPVDDTVGITSSSSLSDCSSSELGKNNIKTEMLNDEDEYGRDLMLSQTIKTEPVAQIKEEVLDSMCAKMELMFPSSSRNSYIHNNNNCKEGQFKTCAHQIWSSDAVKSKMVKVEEVEYFCDICGDDFNSMELLKHHIEVDHFAPYY